MSIWFDIKKINEKGEPVYAILESGHSEEVISYLIIGKETAALIDSGMGIGNIKEVAQRYTDLPIKVINTHSHFDHIGGNRLFDWIAIHEDEAANLELGIENDFLVSQMIDDYVWKPFPKDFRLEKYSIPPCTPSKLLKENDKINLGEYELKVIHTPGHSPGSICLWNVEEGHLFVGDTLYQGPIYGHLDESNMNDYFNSIDKLNKIADQVEFIFPGHNKTPLDLSFLEEVIIGFEKIKDGTAKYSENDLFRTYEFHSFQVLVLVKEADFDK